jgi:hypothetical protein
VQVAVYTEHHLIVTHEVTKMALHVLAYNLTRVMEHHGTWPSDRGNPDIGCWAETVSRCHEPGVGGGFVAAVLLPLVPHGFYTTKTLSRPWLKRQ